MPRAYSGDLRTRVIEAVTSGVSRHEAAELFGIAVSTAVKWWQHWCETGSTAPKPRGGSTSRLEEHRISILRLVKEQPDSTFEEFQKRPTATSIGRSGHPSAPRSPPHCIESLHHLPSPSLRRHPADPT